MRVARVDRLFLGIGTGMGQVVERLVRGEDDWLIHGVEGGRLLQVRIRVLLRLRDRRMPGDHVLGRAQIGMPEGSIPFVIITACP